MVDYLFAVVLLWHSAVCLLPDMKTIEIKSPQIII